VASVTVLPSTATLSVPQTVQLSATPRDAQGNAMSTTVTWSSSAISVATVSQSGLVTAVAAGSATITATAGGQAGSAAITVTQVTSPYGPVVDRQTIGPAGGSVGNTDIAVTIPAGTFSAARTVALVRDTVLPDELGVPRASPRYRITGMTAGQEASVRVRIRSTGTTGGIAAIGTERPAQAIRQADTTRRERLGLTLHQATDSAGYLVATVPLVGRPAPGAQGAPTRANLSAPFSLDADAILSSFFGLARTTVAENRFTIWGFTSLDPQMAAKVQRTATLLTQAEAKLKADLSYVPPDRVTTMQVLIERDASGAYGYFAQYYPYPFDHEKSYIGFDFRHVDNVEFPGTVIHELFHFYQQRFRAGLSEAQYEANNWLQEASSSWVEEKHPASAAPYTASVARSWRDSLYGGLTDGMVANSGYGKAPMLKYITKRTDDARVRSIWTSVNGGTHPVQAVMSALTETPHQWWPDLLYQHFGGSLYPWTVQQIFPTVRYAVPLMPGRRDYGAHTSALKPLQVLPHFLERDTALFGPNFQLPVFLDSSLFSKARLLVIEKPSAATHFRPIAGRDTVLIPGRRLQTTDSIVLLVTNTDVGAPLTARQVGYRIDLQLPEGDWYATTVSNLVDNFRFTCDTPGDSVNIEADSNLVDIIAMFGSGGTWKRKPVPSSPATYEWAVKPGFADSLRMLGITMSATIRESAKDTVYLNAQFRWNLLGGANMSSLRALLVKSDLSWWWWLLPVGLIPVARSKSAKRTLPLVGVALIILVTGCVGLIGFDIDETIDLQFTKVRYEKDPADPNARLMELRAGTGKTVLNRFRSEAWVYTFDANNVKTDSVRRVCTGTGNATYGVKGVVYADGVEPPELSTVSRSDPMLARVERAFDMPGLAQRIKAAKGRKP
jgi:hypothetical protein